MALSGEKISNEMQEKIKEMVESHSQVHELKTNFEICENENKTLKEEVTSYIKQDL